MPTAFGTHTQHSTHTPPRARATLRQARAFAKARPWRAPGAAIRLLDAAEVECLSAAARRHRPHRLSARCVHAGGAARLPLPGLPALAWLLPAAVRGGHVLRPLDHPHPLDPLPAQLLARARPRARPRSRRAVQVGVAARAHPNLPGERLLCERHVQAPLRRALPPLLGLGAHSAGLHLRRHVVAAGEDKAHLLAAAAAAHLSLARHGPRVRLGALRDGLHPRAHVGRPLPRLRAQRLRLPRRHLPHAGPRFRHLLVARCGGGSRPLAACGPLAAWPGHPAAALLPSFCRPRVALLLPPSCWPAAGSCCRLLLQAPAAGSCRPP